MKKLLLSGLLLVSQLSFGACEKEIKNYLKSYDYGVGFGSVTVEKIQTKYLGDGFFSANFQLENTQAPELKPINMEAELAVNTKCEVNYFVVVSSEL